MSAFIMTKDSLQNITSSLMRLARGSELPHAIREKLLLFKDDRDFTAWLYNENAKSVEYRYKDKPSAPLTKPDFKYGRDLNNGQLLKSVKCWMYQSCESPEIENGELFKLMERIEYYLLNNFMKQIPEYVNAEWQ